jgi:hypothetical protein
MYLRLVRYGTWYLYISPSLCRIITKQSIKYVTAIIIEIIIEKSRKVTKLAVFRIRIPIRIRIQRIPMFLGLPDPDPLVRGINPVRGSGSGSTPKCHRSGTLQIRAKKDFREDRYQISKNNYASRMIKVFF